MDLSLQGYGKRIRKEVKLALEKGWT